MADAIDIIACDVPTARALLGVVSGSASSRVILLGPQCPEAGADDLPVDRVVLVPGLTGSDPALIGPGVAELVGGSRIVLLHSGQAGRDLAGWLGARLDLPLVWAVEELRPGVDGPEVERPVGAYRLVQRLPAGTGTIVLARSGEPRRDIGRPVVYRSDMVARPSAVRVTPLDGGSADAPALAGARSIVSVGRGIGGPDAVGTYRRLAELSGSALGASRAAVDSGWLPFAHQVGQTGSTVAPGLYIAFGISGAVQHVAGMGGSERIVAVNTDPDAPILRLADVFIEADADEVAAAVVRRLEERTTDG